MSRSAFKCLTYSCICAYLCINYKNHSYYFACIFKPTMHSLHDTILCFSAMSFLHKLRTKINKSSQFPVLFLQSYMGMWEQEPLNQQHPAKMNDIIDMLHEPSLAHSSGGTTSPTTTIHHQNRGDCHFQSSHYLTPLPNLGDPYSSGECHQIHLEGFPPSSDNNFHKCKLMHFTRNTSKLCKISVTHLMICTHTHSPII